MTCRYPTVTGYLWNLKQKVCLAFNLDWKDVTVMNEGGETVISSVVALDRVILDEIMSNDPCGVPVAGGTHIRIKDLWEHRNWFKEQIGDIDFKFWFDDELDNGGYIHLLFDSDLTAAEKEKVKKAYHLLWQP